VSFVVGAVPEVAGTLGGSSQSGGFRTTDLDNSGAFVPGFWNGEQVTSTLDASVGAKRQTMPEKDRFMAAVVPWTPAPEVADPITANEGSTYTHEGSRNFRLHNVVGFTAKDYGQDAAADLAPTLRSGVHSGSHANGGVMPAVAFKASHFTRGKDGAPSEIYPPLTADADKGDQDPVVLAPNVDPEYKRPRDGEDSDSYWLRIADYERENGIVPGYLRGLEPFSFQARVARNGRGAPTDVVSSLNAQAGETGKGDAAPLVAGTSMRVRRLMPEECELLQGFPKGHTLVLYRGKLMADGPRYKALGNSWAVPCARWIGQRMDMLEGLLREKR
jgi:site-specific DNA-cytosine methylase